MENNANWYECLHCGFWLTKEEEYCPNCGTTKGMDIHPKDIDKLQKHILSLYEKGEIVSPSSVQDREVMLILVISLILTIITAWFYFDSPSGFFDFIFYIFKALGLMIGYYIGTIVLFCVSKHSSKR